MIKVFNVGQGDSFLLIPNNECSFDETPLLIDCGPRNAYIADRIDAERIKLLITHSHKDHTGGINMRLLNKTEEIYIPFYMPEVVEIYKQLRQYLHSNIKRLNFHRLSDFNLKLVAEGDELCNHTYVFNPPRRPEQAFSQFESPMNIDDALDLLGQRGVDLPVEEIKEYQSPVPHEFPNIGDYNTIARQFMHYFYGTLAFRMIDMNLNLNKSIIQSHFELTKNQASIVFTYTYSENNRILFTGDADISVFQRLLNNGEDISAEILKIPHHGSRNNLNINILNEIRPEVAIISHGNGQFGNSRDRHPHLETLEILNINNVKTYFTNDVIKGGEIIYNETIGMVNIRRGQNLEFC